MAIEKKDWSNLSITLAIAGAGAGLFSLLGFPAAPLTGSALAVSLGGLLGAPVIVPLWLRTLCFIVLGTSIGSGVSPAVIDAAITWPASFLALGISLILSMLISRAILVRFFGFDAYNASLASSPGHLSYILSMAADSKADVTRIGLAQSTRVLFLTICVPLFVSLLFEETGASFLPVQNISLLSAVYLLLGAAVVGTIFLKMKLPAAYLLGGMLVSSLGHVSTLTPGKMPDWATLSSFLVMGALIGTRFKGVSLDLFAKAIGAGIVVTLITVGMAILGVVLVMPLVGLDPSLLFVAFAPGGVEAMAAIAVQSGLDPTFVAAHHVFRLLLLTFVVPLLLRRSKTALPAKGQP
ncbi:MULTISPECIES: AbrB family transcriptional regulator [unclassified Pseudovibrio]|uniref:AbrB family transcriptional regulator n=1 Tax=unclassified Pseudovibrio TaxID=2627060 RepID=UPI0007AEC1FF|nr:MULTISPECIES: AbrB family transcriptional regulator [unclassified Pseudovibrio]KZL03745.1 putative ammonia monooxygenase [Pseudovibrio sp. W74]KZL09542.1 putative ammonia monooxygenase [Pseudovibrio sp. Ad14]